MLENSKKNLLDNEVKVTACFINDENTKSCPHIDTKIGNGILKGVIDPRSGISLITENLYTNLLSQGLRDVGDKIAKRGTFNSI
jgi:hypothetical protein